MTEPTDLPIRKRTHAEVIVHLADKLAEAEGPIHTPSKAWEIVRGVELSLRVLALEVDGG